jgi:hypothetical protein
MVFPVNNSEPNGGDANGGNTLESRQNPNNQLFTFKSYAQTVRSQQRDAFVLDNRTLEDLDKLTPSGRQFLEAIDKNSIVIAGSEFNGMNFKEKSLYKYLREQYPRGLGLRMRHVGKKNQYIEINFRTLVERDEAVKKFTIFGKDIKVDRTLDKGASIVRVGISNIPFEDEEFLKPRMIQIFKKYGEILEIGLHHVIDGGWFTGKGFVTLNKKKDTTYAELTPQIASWDAEVKLHLVYTNMKPICSYCHVDDHVRFNCPALAPKKKACYQCGNTDHLRAECPLAPWNRKRKLLKPSMKSQQRPLPVTASRSKTLWYHPPNSLPTKTLLRMTLCNQSLKKTKDSPQMKRFTLMKRP